jgi:thiol-disulfide isomerase/thioredoxin
MDEIKYKNKYLKYKNKYLNYKNNITNIVGGDADADVDSKLSNNNIKEIILFKADWCGHCNNFMPMWNKIQKNELENIKFTTYDADSNNDKIKEYKINGFPTLLMKSNNKLYEYAGERTLDSINNFISSN